MRNDDGLIHISTTTSNEVDDYVTITIEQKGGGGVIRIKLSHDAFGCAILGSGFQDCVIQTYGSGNSAAQILSEPSESD